MDSTTRTLVVVVGILLVVALGLSALMGGVMGPGMMGQGPMGPAAMSGRGWMWGVGMGLGGLVMLTFWGALIVGIVLLVRAIGVGGGPQSHTPPLDTLKRRYAAGEITRDQYEQMRKDIEQ
jgi:putative membrane protein